MSDAARPIGDLLLSLWGPSVWAAHFFVMYAAETLACSRAGASSYQAQLAVVTAAVTAIALISLLGFMIRQYVVPNERAQFGYVTSSWLRRISIVLAALAMLAVVWVALPLTMVPACAGPTIA